MIITKQEVIVFKGVHCNENMLVAEILRQRFSDRVSEPILDVGAGLGDISASVFPEKHVIHLDVLDYSNHPIPQTHTREYGDFLDYDPKGLKINSVMFCHVLQFIDNNISKLNERLALLNPDNILTVVNANNDFMRELIKWFAENTEGSNPEVDIVGFPSGYVLQEEICFTATLVCRDFETLSDQVCFLMDCELPGEQRRALRRYLEHHLNIATFSINEKVKLYRRHKA